jgi:hypothetical protein
VNPRPHFRHHRLRPIAAVAFAVIVTALVAAGCASHHDTPQQQFTGALMRGNAAQASSIWNNMGPEDRASFRRGESLNPEVDPRTTAAQVLEHSSGGFIAFSFSRRSSLRQDRMLHQTEEGVQDGSDDPPATVDIPAN